MPGRRLDAPSTTTSSMTAYESQSQSQPNGATTTNGYTNHQDDDEMNDDGNAGHGHGQASSGDTRDTDDEQGLSRHGFDSSEEVLLELQSRYFLYFTDVRPFYSLAKQVRANAKSK